MNKPDKTARPEKRRQAGSRETGGRETGGNEPAARFAVMQGGGETPARPAIRPAARPARPQSRHRIALASFVLLVVLPLLVTAAYLWLRAEDQYASRLGFSVRSEDARSALDVSGILGQFASGGSSADADILYDFIRSQELVERIDTRLDLRGLYARPYGRDPVFAFDPAGTIEDLVDYWRRMVRIKYDSGTGLIELTALAFDRQEARAIAAAILEESTVMINRLSAIARTDSTRFAREELEQAQTRLREAREALTAFRSRTQIVDPAADVQGQMGVLNTLQAELAGSMIDLDLLRETAQPGDPRISQIERRIEVTRNRLVEERRRFGQGDVAGSGGENYATLISEFERLNVEREFSEAAYRSAQSAYDGAVSEAHRTTRYLAAHVAPTLAESARYPQRWMILGLAGLFLFLGWALMILIYYSIRDRR